MLSGPYRNALDQSGRHLEIPGFEESEKSDTFSVRFIVASIDDSGDPPDDLVLSPSEEKLEVEIVERRVLLGVELLSLFQPEWWYPSGITDIHRVWELDESTQILTRFDRFDSQWARCKSAT